MYTHAGLTYRDYHVLASRSQPFWVSLPVIVPPWKMIYCRHRSFSSPCENMSEVRKLRQKSEQDSLSTQGNLGGVHQAEDTNLPILLARCECKPLQAYR